jgi:drug/metabolite transporter (DMT)-like permease
MPVVPVVLVAAALHATWNAIVKPAEDRLATMAAIGVASVLICLPVALLASAPKAASWPELAASAIVHGVYELLLIATYREGDFNQVYPVARGTAPPTVAIAAGIVAGETLSGAQVAGVLAVSGGLFALATGRRRGSRTALRLAMLTGLAIASCTVLDGIGVRKSGSPVGYTAWLFCANGVMMPLALLAVRKRSAQRLRIPPAILKRGMVAGAISVLAYGLVLWAQTKGALAVVAALRETSVVFAALIGAVVFREHLPVRRLLASAAIGAGAALLALG